MQLYPSQRAGFSVFYPVSVSRCMDCYPTTIGKDFLLWLFAITSNGKNAPTINGSPKFKIILCSQLATVLPTTSGTGFLCFASKCKQVDSLLPTTIGKIFCSGLLLGYNQLENEAKMLPLKMGLPSLGVAFSQATQGTLW